MNQPFQSQTFAITGRLDAGTRGHIQRLIIDKGARVTSRVRKKTTTILIVGHEPGDNALQAAAKLGIPTMPQEEFYAYLKAQPDIIYPNNEDIPLSKALPEPEPDPNEVALLTIFEIIQYTMPDGTWLGPTNWKRIPLPKSLQHLDNQFDKLHTA